jgi:pyruvate,orthophosphate dikinase
MVNAKLETRQRDMWVLPYGRGQRGIPVPKKTVAGQRGNRLVRMAHEGLPVTPGIILGTAFCEAYFDNDRAFTDRALARLGSEVKDFERFLTEKLRLSLPIRVAVRTSPVVKVPGLMPARLDVMLDGSEAGRKKLIEIITDAFDSWGSERAELFQRLNEEAARTGMAVIVHAMGENFIDDGRLARIDTRNRRSGEVGDLDGSPSEQAVLSEFRDELEKHFGGAVSFDAVISSHGGMIVDAESQKLSAAATLRCAVDLVQSGILQEREALMRISAESIEQLLHPTVDTSGGAQLLSHGIAASPGAVSGQIVFTSSAAEAGSARGEPVILVTAETGPEDVAGMKSAEGILTLRGGVTSHAAVVARGLGKPCIAGAVSLRLDVQAGTISIGNISLREHDIITIDGVSGQIFVGEVPTKRPEPTGDFEQVMVWAESLSRLQVRANADTPMDAKAAKRFNADGIGLCRTEHMFFEEGRIGAMRQMILSENEGERQGALDQLLQMQRQDFRAIFETMAGHAVTIRLLDPPLHEFLPRTDNEIAALAAQMKIDFTKLKMRVGELTEANPMLGHRGCRLLISHPEITWVQTRAIFEAAGEAGKTTGRTVRPEILIPLVSLKREVDFVRRDVEKVAAEVEAESGQRIDYSVGTMIELPRACLRAGALAESADFFSFGTNDLTQTAFGLSRDDSGSFLGQYSELGVLEADPFVSVDMEGVGELMRIAVDRGRAVRPDLSVGICGEHGGDPASIEFCEELGIQSISCSPYRVPIARLSAAQAACRRTVRNRP